MRFHTATFILLPLLAACASAPATENYVLTPPENPAGRLCLSQCRSAEDYCQQGCDFDQRTCTSKVEQQAIIDYDSYTRMQFASGQPIELRPSDFERMAPCGEPRKACGNDCDKNYRLCYTTCGGTVETVTSCQFLCF